jgi:transposase
MDVDPRTLPTDLAACHALIGGLVAALDVRDRKLRQLQHQLEQLLRWRYGAKRERVDENQLFLEALRIVTTESAVSPEPTNPDRSTTAAPAAAPLPRPGHGRQRLPAHLKRQRQDYDLPLEQRQCPQCHGPLHPIGEEVSERLEYVPASLLVIEDVCHKYGCARGCTVVTAPKPMQPIEKGLPGPGLLAHVVVNKYADHLPLYRQEAMLARQGVALSRSTLCDWMRRCAELVSPLYALMKQHVLASHAVQTDDTPVAVLDPDLPRTRLGRIWTYVGDAHHPFTVYDYTPTRRQEGPLEFLKSFRGRLQADAYSGYAALYEDPAHAIIEIACWAHARRKFYEAQTSDPMRSMILLAYIRLLYDVEREAREQHLDGAGRLALRQVRSRPILADIRAYLESERPKVLPKSPEGQAISYTLSNWEALCRYGADGALEIDNNGAERSLRGIAVGRKNWMFYGSDHGGQTAAVLSSFVATCKRLHLDPFVYLRDVIGRISAHSANRLAELLPDQWKAARVAADTS